MSNFQHFLLAIEDFGATYPNILNVLIAVGTCLGAIATFSAVWVALHSSKANLKISSRIVDAPGTANSNKDDLSNLTLLLTIKNNSLFSISYSHYNNCHFNFLSFGTLNSLPNNSSHPLTGYAQPKGEGYAWIRLTDITKEVMSNNPTFARLRLWWCNLYFVTQSGEPFKIKVDKEVRNKLLEYAPSTSLSWRDIFTWAIGNIFIWISITLCVIFLIYNYTKLTTSI